MSQHNKKQVKKEFIVLLGLSPSKQLGCLLGKPSQFGLGINGHLGCPLWTNCSLGIGPP